MIQICEVVLVLWIFKSGDFFLAHPVEGEEALLGIDITSNLSKDLTGRQYHFFRNLLDFVIAGEQ